MSHTNIYEGNPLFEDVQLAAVFEDSKTFVDCVPLQPLPEIEKAYEQEKLTANFDLTGFVHKHFRLPTPFGTVYEKDEAPTVEDHLALLWDHLTRTPGREHSSLIQLPYPYIVPGGRFGEIYYWDSFFTMLGLKVSGRVEMLENMVNNFSYLIKRVGYIPNGNRAYYIGRSQPPFFSHMVRLLMEVKGPGVLREYSQQLEQEYTWWMKGEDELQQPGAMNQVVYMPGGEILNRFWDEHDTPRPEAYRQDVELAHESDQPAHTVYRHLRAGAASGWDFSSRWFTSAGSFASIHTGNLIPVDLNCLLYQLELLISEAARQNGQPEKEELLKQKAHKRAAAILHYCWDQQQEFFYDYNFITHTRSQVRTLAAAFPLFAGIATAAQALPVANQLAASFLKAGGLLTTLNNSGQQWDAPNGWAPLQWIAISGLDNYGFQQLAKEIAARWVALNRSVYKRTGKMMEKYNVVDISLDAGGGEYAGQDGFGWTNGVYLDLTTRYQL